MDFKEKYLKYKAKYLELKKKIGGYITAMQIAQYWEEQGLAVWSSAGQDGFYLSFTNNRDFNNHIHLYSDGSYTYKIDDLHYPSRDREGAAANFFSIYHNHPPDEFGIRLYENDRINDNVADWAYFLYNQFSRRLNS